MDAAPGDSRRPALQRGIQLWCSHEFTITTIAMIVIVAGQIISYIFRDTAIVKVDWPLLIGAAAAYLGVLVAQNLRRLYVATLQRLMSRGVIDVAEDASGGDPAFEVSRLTNRVILLSYRYQVLGAILFAGLVTTATWIPEFQKPVCRGTPILDSAGQIVRCDNPELGIAIWLISSIAFFLLKIAAGRHLGRILRLSRLGADLKNARLRFRPIPDDPDRTGGLAPLRELLWFTSAVAGISSSSMLLACVYMAFVVDEPAIKRTLPPLLAMTVVMATFWFITGPLGIVLARGWIKDSLDQLLDAMLIKIDAARGTDAVDALQQEYRRLRAISPWLVSPWWLRTTGTVVTLFLVTIGLMVSGSSAWWASLGASIAFAVASRVPAVGSKLTESTVLPLRLTLDGAPFEAAPLVLTAPVAAPPPTPISPRAVLDRLSAREREVAVLIASGLTNKQIADRLVLSPRTVERHVENMLGKLDLARRAQVASLVSAAGEIPVSVAEETA